MSSQSALKKDPLVQARVNMVESQVRPGGVRDARICKAMTQTPREAFICHSQKDLAYADVETQMISNTATRLLPTPYAFSRLAELAEVNASDIVLDIAGGSGYSAAILARLAATVIALEDDEGFAEMAGEIWQNLGIDNVVSVFGPLEQGQAKQGPFDVIFINGKVEVVPQTLLDQLADRGRLVCCQSYEGADKALVVTRIKDSFSYIHGTLLSMPDVTTFNKKPEFQF